MSNIRRAADKLMDLSLVHLAETSFKKSDEYFLRFYLYESILMHKYIVYLHNISVVIKKLL